MMYCDDTLPANGGCDGWTGAAGSWPWHGCAREPEHTMARHVHRCKCGHEWGKASGRPKGSGRK